MILSEKIVFYYLKAVFLILSDKSTEFEIQKSYFNDDQDQCHNVPQLPPSTAAFPSATAGSGQPVINPGYDALLYRRLYHSPPPPLPPKAARMRRNSDSAVSDCSPPSPTSPGTPTSPGEALLADKLAAHTVVIPK